ncbi:MAG: hypothetical protein HY078_02795 [Elusimicrobia bacterium]|nr:hypothetical protein [Elusimicrobiota bacterium]
MFRVRSLHAAAFLTAAVAGIAAAGCWDNCCSNWSQFQAACACQGGTAVPNPPRCIGGGGGGGAPAPASPGVLQRRRWNSLIERGLVQSYFAKQPVATDAEFSETLGHAYTHLSRDIAVLNAQAVHYDAQAAYEMDIHETFYVPRFANIDVATSLAPNVRDARDAARSEERTITAEANRLKAFREDFVFKQKGPSTASRLHREWALDAKQRVYVYFGGISRKDVERYAEASSSALSREPCCDVHKEATDLYWLQGATGNLDLKLAVTRADEAVANAKGHRPAAPPADLETRLRQVETLAEDRGAASKRSAAAGKHYRDEVHNWYTAKDKTTWDSTVADNLRAIDETRILRQRAIPMARIDLKFAKDVLRGDIWEMLQNGGTAAAWSALKKHVIEPEIKRAALTLTGARPDLTDGEVKEAWKLDKHALFGAYADYKKTEGVASLVKTTLNIEEGGERSALAVADALGRAGPADVQEIGDQIFAGVDAAARKEVKDSLALVKLPAPIKKFWEAYFAGPKLATP